MPKILKSLLLTFFSLSILLFVNPLQSHAFTGLYTLGLDVSKQEKSNWCWAASSVGILKYYGINKTQTQFVTYVKGSAVNQTAGDSEANAGLEYYGKPGTVSTSSLSYSQVYTKIYTNNDPIYAGWSWTAGGGHAVVIMGINNANGSDVYYEDPGDGARYRTSHSWMVNGGGHVWDGSIYNF